MARARPVDAATCNEIARRIVLHTMGDASAVVPDIIARDMAGWSEADREDVRRRSTRLYAAYAAYHRHLAGIRFRRRVRALVSELHVALHVGDEVLGVPEGGREHVAALRAEVCRALATAVVALVGPLDDNRNDDVQVAMEATIADEHTLADVASAAEVSIGYLRTIKSRAKVYTDCAACGERVEGVHELHPPNGKRGIALGEWLCGACFDDSLECEGGCGHKALPARGGVWTLVTTWGQRLCARCYADEIKSAAE